MMCAPVIPAGVKPLGVWDTREDRWHRDLAPGASAWAVKHIADANSTYRAEFYLIDGPFAVLYRYVRDETGHVSVTEPDGEPVTAEPVVQALDELPAAHLLGRQA